MSKTISRWTLVIPLAAAVACSSSSQQEGTGAGVAPIKDEPIVHTYTVPAGEFIRVPFVGGATYHVELDGTGFRLQVKPVEPGAQAPLIQELVPGVGAAGTVIYSLKPRADGVYEIRSIAGDPTRPMTLRITRVADREKD